MKALRIKHYGYVLATGLLFVSCLVIIFANLRTASAEVSQVTITSPGPNQELAYKDQVVRGKAPSSKKIKVFDGDKFLGETTSDNSGNWSFEWKKVSPGEHQLNAYLVDGSVYTTSPTDPNAASAVNLNSGQADTNYKAGLAVPEAIVYDKSNNLGYALNKVNHTISVINTVNYTYQETISYASADALEPNQADSSSCHCQNFTYTYDEQSRQLFIFDLERIYIISTQTNQLVRAIQVTMPVQAGEYTGDGPEYKLYTDGQAEYVYLYVADNTYEDQPIQRYSISTGQLDQGFNINGSRVVSGPNTDLYYIDRTNGAASDSQASLLYKYDASSATSTRIDLSSVGCETADVKNLAISSSQENVYVGCYVGSGTNFPSKQIAINTNNGNLSDVTISNNEQMVWLTEGNLKTNRLAIVHADGENSSIKSLNTDTNTAQPEIVVPSFGAVGSEVRTMLRGSFAINSQGQFSYLAKGGQTSDESFFSVELVSSDTGSSISRRIFKYPWTTATLEVLQNATVANFVPDTKTPAFLDNGDLIYLSGLPGSALQRLKSSSSEFEPLQYGVGATTSAYSSKLTNRLFTTNDASVVANGYALPLLSNRIAISNLQTGAYQTSISIGPTKVIRSAYMDPSGRKLYIFASDLQEGTFNTNKIDIYRMDTQTLLVDKSFEGVDFNSQSSLDDMIFLDQSNVSVVGDELIFAASDTSKVYLFNINSGSVRTYDNTPDPNYSGNVIISSLKYPFAIDPLGKYIAVLHKGASEYEIKVVNIDDLTVQSSVSADSILPSSMTFTAAGKLVVGGMAYKSGVGSTFSIINPEDGHFIKQDWYLTSYYQSIMSAYLSGSIDNLSVCVPINMRPLKEGGNYISTSFMCIKVQTGSREVKEYSAVIDGENLNILSTTEVESITANDVSSPDYSIYEALDIISANDTDTTISKATQNVSVIADKISILTPEKGKDIKAGGYTITGTATPEQTLTIKVDGKSIGNATADKYGLWQKKTNFTGDEQKIDAVFSAPAYDRAFMHSLQYDVSSMVDNGSSNQVPNFTSGLSVINTNNGVAEKNFILPEDLFSLNSTVSKDQKKLYVLGFSLTNKVKLLEYNTHTNQLISSLDLTSNVQDALPGVQDFTGAGIISSTLSEDESKIYVNGISHLLVIDTKTGSVLETYPLGDEYVAAAADTQNAVFSTAPVIAENLQMASLPYLNGHGFALIDLQSGAIQQAQLPQGVTILKQIVDNERGFSYTFVKIEDGTSRSYEVSAFDLSNGSQLWDKTVEGYTGLTQDMVFSPATSKLALLAGKQTGENSFEGFLVEIDALTGGLSETKIKQDSQDANTIALLSSNNTAGYSNLAVSNDGNRYYLSVGALGFGGILVRLDRDSSQAKIIFTSYNDLDSSVFGNGILMLFGNLSDSFTANIAQKTLSASRNISFESVGGGTVVPQCPDCTGVTVSPPIVKPPIPNVKPPVAVAAARIKPAQGDSVLQISAVKAFQLNLFAAVKKFANSVPLPLIQAYPYVLMVLLLGLIGYYLFQTQKQLRREDRLRDIFEKQKVLAEEKRNFLELASHYLRTPLTYIKAGSEIILRNKQNEAAATELSESVGHLSLFVESLVEEASTNDQIEAIEPPERKVWSPLLTKSFILPVIGFAAALGVFYLIFGVIGGFNFGPAKYITQLLIMFVVIQLFYGMFKNHQKILDEEEVITKTLNSEAALDHTRSKLMKDAGEQLQTRTAHLKSVINKLQSADTSKAIMQQGVDRLSELSGAFALVGKLESEVMLGSVEQVSVRTMAADIIQPMVDKFREKKVRVEVSGFDNDIMLTTNKPLAELTLKTLLSNALGASKEGSSLVVKCLHRDGRVAFQVIDHGEGIPKDKIDRLFKPFVRVGPVTTFNREGIGLSLYLDRLIMHSLGGEVEIVSRFKHGTTATAIFNQKKTA